MKKTYARLKEFTWISNNDPIDIDDIDLADILKTDRTSSFIVVIEFYIKKLFYNKVIGKMTVMSNDPDTTFTMVG